MSGGSLIRDGVFNPKFLTNGGSYHVLPLSSPSAHPYPNHKAHLVLATVQLFCKALPCEAIGNAKVHGLGRPSVAQQTMFAERGN